MAARVATNKKEKKRRKKKTPIEELLTGFAEELGLNTGAELTCNVPDQREKPNLTLLTYVLLKTFSLDWTAWNFP